MKSEKILRAMTEIDENLIKEAAPENPVKASGKHRFRWTAAAAAAVLVLTVSVYAAGASAGIFPGWQELFGPMFSPNHSTLGEQKELSEDLVSQLGTPLGQTVEDGGLRVTADAVLRDRFTCFVLFTLEMDGIEAYSEDFLSFWDAMPGGCLADRGGSSWYIYDDRPGDGALRCVYSAAASENGFGEGPAQVTFHNLIRMPEGDGESTNIAEGTWSFAFDAPYTDLSVDITGEPRTVEVEGVPVTVNEVTISPLGMQMRYTADTTGIKLSRSVTMHHEGMPDHEETLRTRLRHPDVAVETADGQRDGTYLIGGLVDTISCDFLNEDEGDPILEGYITFNFSWPTPLEDIARVIVEGEEYPVP